MNSNTNLKLLLICSVIFLISSYAEALMVGMSTEKLTNDAEVVVKGDVVDSKSYWSSDGKSIVTQVRVRYSEVIKGEVVSREFIVEHLGGMVGDLGMSVSDTSEFKKGEQVILFLNKGMSKVSGEAYNVTGRAQGKYTVGSDGIARKKGFSVVPGDGVIDNNIPEDELINKIKRVK